MDDFQPFLQNIFQFYKVRLKVMLLILFLPQNLFQFYKVRLKEKRHQALDYRLDNFNSIKFD